MTSTAGMPGVRQAAEAVTVLELADGAPADELKLGQKLICAGEGFAAVVD